MTVILTPNTLMRATVVNDEFDYVIQTKNIPNENYFEYTLVANQTTVATTVTKLQMNSPMSHDLSEYPNYSPANCAYTTPYAGLYKFSMVAQLQSQTATPFIISLGYNSATAEWRRLMEIPNTTGNITLSGSIEEYIPAGVVIYPLYYSGSSGKLISATSQLTRWQGLYITP